jgi:hypothetical protein
MLNLQEKIYEKMNTLVNYKEQIIYQSHQNDGEDDIEILTIIVKIKHSRYRIYKGTKYNKTISVEYMSIEEDMIKAITSNLKVSLGEVQ